MRAFVRRAGVSAAAAGIAVAAITGCTSEEKAAPTPSTAASAPADSKREGVSKDPSPSSSPGPAIKLGGSGRFDFIETDEYGENPKVATQLEVTAKSAEYVTPADVDTTNKPKGQYVRLTLTVKNVGAKPGDFAAYGMMKWEDGKTAAQDASTLEGVGDGPDLDTTYKPGQSVTGSIVLDVGAKGGAVSYWADPMADGPAFTIELPAG
ncbi:DUF4352 domain-containing protein [Streptomyces sp. NPDC057748]|uniref:DUF4352 domain-containing protein n=1 Tax=unclassified Streptomyces TaxID=2593676 RepID=UPI00369E0440